MRSPGVLNLYIEKRCIAVVPWPGYVTWPRLMPFLIIHPTLAQTKGGVGSPTHSGLLFLVRFFWPYRHIPSAGTLPVTERRMSLETRDSCRKGRSCTGHSPKHGHAHTCLSLYIYIPMCMYEHIHIFLHAMLRSYEAIEICHGKQRVTASMFWYVVCVLCAFAYIRALLRM